MTELRCLISPESLIGNCFRAASPPAKNGFFSPENRFVQNTSRKSVHGFVGDPLQAGWPLRREDALIYRAGLLNKTGPVEVTLRDKLNNFAHLLTNV
jgi:hypothetical protein